MKIAQLNLANRLCSWFLPSLLCLLFALPSQAFQSTNHLETAVELVNRGDLEGAEKEARIALQAPGDRALAWGILGSIRVQQKRYDEGAEFLRKAINVNPRMVGAHVTLGGVYVLQGKNEKAREMFRDALRLDPTNFNARLDLVQLESGEDNFRASMEAAKPIISELEHSTEGIILLAKNYSGLQKKESLAALVTNWSALPDPPPPLSASFASLLIKNGLGREGIKIVEKARSTNPTSFDLTFALAAGYSSVGDVKQAAENYGIALNLSDDCVPCLIELARIADHEGNTEKALAYLIRAKQIEPENPEVLFAFGKVCLERDLDDDAIGALTKAAALKPDVDPYVYVLASAYVARKEYKEARILLEGLLKKHPADAFLHYGLGSVLFLAQDLDLARQHLQKSIELQPNQRAAYYYLGLVAEGQNNSKQAIEILRDLLHRYPDYALPYEALGSILLKERDFTQALQILEKAVQLNANSVKAHYQLGMLLGRIGKQEESNTQLEIARKLEADERAKNELQLHILMPD
jgi:tetratricopeptide (TPR) repeat protein